MENLKNFLVRGELNKAQVPRAATPLRQAAGQPAKRQRAKHVHTSRGLDCEQVVWWGSTEAPPCRGCPTAHSLSSHNKSKKKRRECAARRKHKKG